MSNFSSTNSTGKSTVSKLWPHLVSQSETNVQKARSATIVAFARVSRKPISISTKPARPNVNSIYDNTSDNSVNAFLNMNYSPEYKSIYDSSDDNTVASIASNTLHIESKNKILPIGNTKVGLLIESGSVFSILNESLVTKIINNSSPVRCLTTAPSKNLKILPMSQFL